MPIINELEELSLNAWPAHQSLLYSGWVLRFSGGYTSRANSINPLYDTGRANKADLLAKIKDCEDLYTAKGFPTIFKLTPASKPDELEETLAGSGYLKSDSVSVQILDLADAEQVNTLSGIADPGGIRIVGDNELSPEWLEAWLELSRPEPRHRPQIEKLLSNILPERYFLRLERDGQVLATGLAVCDRGYVGLFDIVTAPASRQQGWGTRLVADLLNWGQLRGAGTAYLQVQTTNLAALRLYARLGFSEVYQYWYRIKQLP
jgi:GNAT superfamily N-acetyltransferase